MKKLLAGAAVLIFLTTGCTWRDTANVTANALVFTAMSLTGNAGDLNMNADLVGQAAGDIVDLAFGGSNCTD